MNKMGFDLEDADADTGGGEEEGTTATL